jgi:hypothetical protein
MVLEQYKKIQLYVTTFHVDPDLRRSQFSWEEKLVAPLIAAPNGEMRKWEDKGTEHKCLTTGYKCNCNTIEITILFCKQIG